MLRGFRYEASCSTLADRFRSHVRESQPAGPVASAHPPPNQNSCPLSSIEHTGNWIPRVSSHGKLKNVIVWISEPDRRFWKLFLGTPVSLM
jgi:hypothetical protein